MDPQELEALYVRVYGRDSEFVQMAQRVEAQTKRLKASLETVSTAAIDLKNIMSSLGVVAQSSGVASMATVFRDTAATLRTLTTGTKSLSTLVATLQKLAGLNMAEVARSLKGLGDAFMKSGIARIGVARAAANMGLISTAMKDMLAISGTSNLPIIGQQIAQSLQAVSDGLKQSKLHTKTSLTALQNIQSVPAFLAPLMAMNVTSLSTVASGIRSGLTDIGVALQSSKLHTLTGTRALLGIRSLQRSLEAMSMIDLSGLGSVRTGLQDLFGAKNAADSLIKVLQSSQLGYQTKQSVGARVVIQQLQLLGTGLYNLGRTNIPNARLLIGGLQGMMSSLAAFSIPPQAIKNMVGIGTGIGGMAKSLANLSKISVSDAVSRIQVITGNLIPAMQGLGAPNLNALSGNLARVKMWLDAINGMVNARSMKRMFNLSIGLGTLTPELTKLANVTLPPPTQFVNWIGAFAATDVRKIQSVSRAFINLANGIVTVQAANMGQVLANLTAFTKWINQLGAISPDALKAFQGIGRAAAGVGRMFAAASANGIPLPGITSNVTNKFIQASGAAGRAKTVFQGLGNVFRSMFGPIQSVTGGLGMMKLSLAGISALGLYSFGKIDEALVRTMSNMRDWQQKGRKRIEDIVFGQSGKSSTSALNLTKGIDEFLSRGMNIPMAGQAMEIAENFSLASGMDMKTATEKLTDAQWALGLASDNTEEHFRNMNRLADYFVGVAPRVNSSVQEMTESLGRNFASAIRYHNIELKDAIALQAAYSLQGIKGLDADDRAARFIREMAKANVLHYWTWKNMGLSVFDDKGKYRPVADILENLTKVLESRSDMSSAALEQVLGIENRAFMAIQPVMGMSDAIRNLKDEVDSLDGTTKKYGDAMRETFIGQLKMAWNNVSNFAEVIGKQLAPVIGWIGKQIGTLTAWFRGLSEPMQKLVVSFGLMSVAMLALRPLMGMFFSMPFTVMRLGLTIGQFLINPFTILATLLTAIAALMGSFFLPNFKMGDFLGSPDYWKKSLDAMAGFFWNFQENMSQIGQWAATNWRDILGDIGVGILTIFKNLIAEIGKLLLHIPIILSTIGVELFSWISRLAKYIGAVIAAEMLAAMPKMFGGISEQARDERFKKAEEWYDIRAKYRDYNVDHNNRIIEETSTRRTSLWDSIVQDLKNARQVLPGMAPDWNLLRGASFSAPNLLNSLNLSLPDQRNWVERFYDDTKKQVERQALLATNPDKFVIDSMFAGKGMYSHFKRSIGMTAGGPGMAFGYGLATGQVKPSADSTGILGAIDVINSLSKMDPSKSLKSMTADQMNLSSMGMTVIGPWLEKIGVNLIPAWARKMLAPHKDAGEAEGFVANKEGPGFKFQQVSQERFMVGGHAAELLDYQQLIALRLIADRMLTLTGIISGSISGRSDWSTINLTPGTSPVIHGPPVIGP